MAFSINEMRSQLVGGGARSSHFQVVISNPFVPAADIKVPFMVKATSVPTFSLGRIDVPYFGRKIPVAGDRVWEDWNTTVINDEDHIVKNSLEEWQNVINAFRRNINQAGANPAAYKSQALITHYSKDGSELRTYQLEGVWPMYVGAIDLGWEINDTIEEFAVTWAYDTLEVVGGVTGNAGGA